MAIFQKSVIKKHLHTLNTTCLNTAYNKFKEIFNPEKIQTIINLKEEEYQDGFLRDLFVEVLGYTLKPDKDFNLVREFKNQTDGKKVDAAIVATATTRGHVPLTKAVAVIELKSTKTKDLTSITEQAFNYKHNQPGCKYVITSNFQKLRFYVDYSNEYEEFDLFNLQKADFELLYLILRKNAIFNDLPQKLKDETKFHEEKITEQLYKDYSNFKNKIFENIVIRNPEIDKLTLFKKSQKLLDRLLFIFFAEDSGLLPANSISRIIERYEQLKKLDAYKPLYEIYLQYFGYMNIGRKGEIPADDIPAYNGGLFAPDELLNNLKIDDKVLKVDSLKLSTYDFNTDVDVNILGHIFEHSLSEIEEMEAELSAPAREDIPLSMPISVSKRKKDGVFYTPKYITQYIVENTIGTLCTEKRKEMQIY
ncbi:MAG: type IIL restriction-modification enzyme MmeI, partial [Bacteroidota bacterium]|nr:type IIL restriction-modification enzyme MmeI [Bacteroidota bacterium]